MGYLDPCTYFSLVGFSVVTAERVFLRQSYCNFLMGTTLNFLFLPAAVSLELALDRPQERPEALVWEVFKANFKHR